eukprot:c19087_g1_i1.p1 GENE.c19087_g1_i1~~c19087_g1_i1.p1  ORF type:complete len:992 (+),score=364.22 c19087_g1_i1:72-3047(+)
MKSSVVNSATSAVNMRGLTVFISDIRQCQSKEAEQRRVDKELAHIRQKFLTEASLSSYHKKKYVWKMLYIYILGYELDFGHMEAINLVCGHVYSEKSVGYLGCTLLLHEGHELLALLINTMRMDILSQNEHFQTLALSCICNIGSKDFSEALGPDIIRLLAPPKDSGKVLKNVVKKRACLCLLRLFRKVPEILVPEEWADSMIALLDERNMGVLTSVMALYIGVVSRNPKGYEEGVPKICRLLSKYVIQKDFSTDYSYYSIPSPWLQVKLLHALQYFPPPEDRQLRDVVYKVLSTILNETDLQKNINRTNAVHAVFFEAIRLVIHLGESSTLLPTACNLLGKFITIKDSNLRYLGLQTMAEMAEKNDVNEHLSRHQTTILTALFKENDSSIRRQCLDLIFNICDDYSAEEVVSELLRFLEQAEHNIKEDLVLKIAVLAERHASDYSWYFDTILKLIGLAGDFVAEDVWWRVVQVVTNNQEVQLHAAQKVLEDMAPQHVHETLIKASCHILGEFGDLLVRNGTTTPQALFNVFQSKFGSSSIVTKSMILTTYAKFANVFPELATQIQSCFQNSAVSADSESQQRSCEYISLSLQPVSLQNTVFGVMPPFPERESSVLKLIKKKTRTNVPENAENNEEKRSQRDDEDRVSVPEYRHQEPKQAPSKTVDLLELISDPSPVTQSAPIASTQPVAPSRVGLDSLLDLAGPSVPVQNQPVKQVAGGGLLDLNEMLGVASTPEPTFGRPDPQAVQQHQVNHSKLLSSRIQDGVLYEDSTILIAVKAQFNRHQAKIAIYFSNKTPYTFTNFSSKVPAFAEVEMNHKPAQNVVASNQQAQHLIMAQCVAVFGESPELNVSFNVTHSHVELSLKLPIAPSCFFVPQQVDATQFFATWGGLSGDGKDKQVIFPAKAPNFLEKAALDHSIVSLGFSTLAGIDQNPNNVVAAAVFATSTSTNPVVCRIESNARDGLIRASVRSTSAAVSQEVLRLVRFQLGASQ